MDEKRMVGFWGRLGKEVHKTKGVKGEECKTDIDVKDIEILCQFQLSLLCFGWKD